MSPSKSENRAGKAAARPAGAAKTGSEANDASLGRRVWDQVGPIGVAILVALAIRAVIIESYYVPSGSMLSTMLIGDHVFVSKFMFGAHIPFTGITLPAVRDPKRGEIAVFALGRSANGVICPLDQCPDYAAEGFVKRIVGVPGDTVEYRDGRLILNGELVPQRDLGQIFADERGVKMRVLEEDLEGCRHRVLDIPGTGGLTQEPMTVPADHYFLMGDNRDNSNDSRAWGTVHRNDLKGPVLIDYWSWNNNRSWLAMLNPITWIQLLFGEMRWDRIGMTFRCETGPAPAAPEESAPAPAKKDTK